MNRKIFAPALAVLTGFIVYSSCTKVDTTDLGKDLIPAVDNIHTFETVLDVVTDNFLFNDTTRIPPASPQGLGIISNDPEFGKTEAAIYAALSPAASGTHPFLEKDSVKIDSIVLSLAYTSTYGDSNAMEQVEVYEIDPAPNNFKDSVYMIKEPEFTLLPTLLGKRTVDFKILNDSLSYVNNKTDTVRTKNELRIPLDTAFGRRFVNYDTAVQYKTDSAFRTFFRGLAIKVNDGASPAKNALAYFDLTKTDQTRINFYIRVTRDGKTDTLTTAFTYNGRNQANLVRRTPANNYLNYLNNGNPDDDVVYLQSSPGSYATVKIKGMDTVQQVNRIVHRAELIVEKLPSQLDNIYTPPQILFVDAINNAGDSTFTIRNDFIYDFNNGVYDITTLGGVLNTDKYIFNLTRYVQSIVTKKQPFYTLRVYAPFTTDPYYQLPDVSSVVLPRLLFVNRPIADGRLVAGGGSHPTKKMRLRIIYSKI